MSCRFELLLSELETSEKDIPEEIVETIRCVDDNKPSIEILELMQILSAPDLRYSTYSHA